MNSARIVTIIGNRPQFVKAAAVSRRCASATRSCSCTPASTTTTSCRGSSSTSSASRARPRAGRRLGLQHRADGAHPGGARAGARRAAPATWRSSTATPTRRSPARSRPRRPGIPVGHVEAGMRSFDRSMPEELNRVLTDHASDLLLCSTETAVDNLAREGVRGEAHLVGDVMADVSLAFRAIAAERSTVLERPRAGAGRVPARDRPPRRQRRRPERARAARGAAGGAAAAGRVPGPPAHARAARGRRACSTRLDGRDAGAAARLPRLPRAGAARARGPDRLRRRAEGGLPARACRA